MNVFAKFDENPSLILQDIKETKTLRTHGRTVRLSDGRTDNVKTVYPPTNTVCRGYNSHKHSLRGGGVGGGGGGGGGGGIKSAIFRYPLAHNSKLCGSVVF